MENRNSQELDALSIGLTIFAVLFIAVGIPDLILILATGKLP
jgi:hypothetical protein